MSRPRRAANLGRHTTEAPASEPYIILSGPLWRAARRLHIAGSWLIAFAVLTALSGFFTVLAIAISDLDNKAEIAIGAGVSAAFFTCLLSIGGFGAQAYAQSILEVDRRAQANTDSAG